MSVLSNDPPLQADFLEAGASGPVVRPLSSRTASEKYGWSNNIISVGVGHR
jgi:hypothetical protein